MFNFPQLGRTGWTMDLQMARMTVAELEAYLCAEFPQMFLRASIAIEQADGRTCRVREAYDEGMLRPGGTVSGPTLMELADFAMYVVLLSAIGSVGLAVTTNLNLNVLSKAPAGHDLIAEGRLLKLGKRLAVGEVTMYSSAGPEPVAHVTSTYSIPPKRD
jgi:uncharacterized protein (TIGR00369 family)